MSLWLCSGYRMTSTGHWNFSSLWHFSELLWAWPKGNPWCCSLMRWGIWRNLTACWRSWCRKSTRATASWCSFLLTSANSIWTSVRLAVVGQLFLCPLKLYPLTCGSRTLIWRCRLKDMQVSISCCFKAVAIRGRCLMVSRKKSGETQLCWQIQPKLLSLRPDNTSLILANSIHSQIHTYRVSFPNGSASSEWHPNSAASFCATVFCWRWKRSKRHVFSHRWFFIITQKHMQKTFRCAFTCNKLMPMMRCLKMVLRRRWKVCCITMRQCWERLWKVKPSHSSSFTKASTVVRGLITCGWRLPCPSKQTWSKDFQTFKTKSVCSANSSRVSSWSQISRTRKALSIWHLLELQRTTSWLWLASSASLWRNHWTRAGERSRQRWAWQLIGWRTKHLSTFLWYTPPLKRAHYNLKPMKLAFTSQRMIFLNSPRSWECSVSTPRNWVRRCNRSTHIYKELPAMQTCDIFHCFTVSPIKTADAQTKCNLEKKGRYWEDKAQAWRDTLSQRFGNLISRDEQN